MTAQNLTYLQIINTVLPRLREATVAAVTTTTYSTLISTLINQVKTEIEDAWMWHALRDTFTVNCIASTTSYTLTGAGRGANIISAFNTSVPLRMKRSTIKRFDDLFFGVTTVNTGNPSEYQVAGYDASYNLKVEVWPKPTTTDTLKFNLYIPQNDLSVSTDVPLIPINPLIEGVVARAMLERGDDGGTAVQIQEQVYRNLLADAIALDAGHDPSEVNWIIV